MFSKKLFLLSSKIKKIVPASVKYNLKKYGYKIISLFLNILEPGVGEFFTFYTRPMYAVGVSIIPACPVHDYSEYAIVMQGPIALKHRFTLETLLLYKKYFPNAFIVLSTWEGEDIYTVNCVRNAGIEVILNKKPDAGLFNVNLQTVSSMAGLRLVAKMNKKYVLKTRTDQRIYNSESLIFLSNLLKNFPVTIPGFKQKGRLIGIGAYNYKIKRKPYHLVDNLIFGYIEDVLLYFGADFISDNPPALEFLKDRYPNAPFTAEGYLFTEFLKKIGHKPENTPEDYLRSLAMHCILADARSLGWYWFKYKRFIEYQNLEWTYKNNGHLSFVEWFNLYNSYQ